MSRHGYSDDLEQPELAMWRGRVASAIRGRRGQRFLAELLAALDAVPGHRLVKNALEANGEVCALGSLAKVKGIDTSQYDYDNPEWMNADLSERFKIAECLVQEVEYENDEGRWNETPEQRWERMRAWVVHHLKPCPPGPEPIS